MEITKIIAIGIIGTIATITVKNHRMELGVCIALLCGAMIFLGSLPQLESVISMLSDICRESGVTASYFGIIIKVIGIAYVTQFASEIARDSGEGAIAKKLEFAGKVGVLYVMMPTVKNLLDVITSTLMSF